MFQNTVTMRGLKKLRMFCRRLVFAKNSKLDLSGPRLTQRFNTLLSGARGADGKDGVHGTDG